MRRSPRIRVAGWLEAAAGLLRRVGSRLAGAAAPADAVMRRRLARIEARIRHQEHEHGYLVGQDGAVLLHATSELKHEIRCSPHLDRLCHLRDSGQLVSAVCTHNHPHGFAPSVDDIVCAVKWNFREFRVVCMDISYAISRPAGGWPPGADVRALWNAARSTATRDLFVQLREGKLSREEVQVRLWHDTCVATLAELGARLELR